jgi:hypothetical protein
VLYKIVWSRWELLDARSLLYDNVWGRLDMSADYNRKERCYKGLTAHPRI